MADLAVYRTLVLLHRRSQGALQCLRVLLFLSLVSHGWTPASCVVLQPAQDGVGVETGAPLLREAW